MASVAAKMLKGSLWLTAARALVNLLAFVGTIALARLLTPLDFGLVAIGLTLSLILKAVTEMSLAQALVQHRDPTDDHIHTAWTLGLARGVVLGVAMAAIARPLTWIYGEPRLEPICYALAVSLFLSGLMNPRRALLAKSLVFWQDFVVSVADKLLYVTVSIGVAFFYHSYWALIAGVIAAQAGSVLVSYAILPFRPRVMWRHTRELWSFSVWLTLGQAMNTINWRFDQLVVGHFLGRSTLGLYTVGDTLAQIPTREAIMPLTGTLFPALSRIADEPERLRAAYQRAQAIVTMIALPAGIGFALIASPMVHLAMGAKWLGAVIVIQALSPIFAIQTLGSMVQPLGMATGATRVLFVRDLQMFVTRLPIVIGAMMLFGLPGLIGGRIVTGLISAVVNMRLVDKLIGLPMLEQLRANLRALVSAVVMAAGVVVANRLLAPAGAGELALILEVVGSMTLGAILYIGSNVVLWIAMGRPAGPEKEIGTMLGRALGRFNFSRGVI